MKMRHLLSAGISGACLLRVAIAAEPNETFGTSTVLPSGALIVSDALIPSAGGEPETLIGVRNQFGEIYGVAPGSPGVSAPTNSGSINFSITGVPDEFFEGSHGEEGAYEVFVNAYDLFGDLVDSFSETRTLMAGEVHDFNYDDFEWINGSYDVFVDNTVGAVGDVDFFTFTGLTAGAAFTAETFDPEFSNVDTVLGWFDSVGTFIIEDDDSGEGALSKLQGTVPNDGTLTFAVTGFGDAAFEGAHIEAGAYELRIVLDPGLAGDFNGDNQVDAEDLTVWRQDFSATSAAADADGDGDSDGQDFLVWQRNLGEGVPSATAIQATPEPSGATLLTAALAGLSLLRTRRGH